MQIISEARLTEEGAKRPDLISALEAWYQITSQARWISFPDLQTTFSTASQVSGEEVWKAQPGMLGERPANLPTYVVFNIRGNKYRMVTIVKYSVQKEDSTWTGGRVFIRSVLTHEEYNDKGNWDKGMKQWR